MQRPQRVPAQAERLFETDGLRVDVFRAGQQRVAFTYRAGLWDAGKREGPAFADHLLLRLGFDVIAFTPKWTSGYQDVPESLIDDLSKVATSYEGRVAYGPSMGGYGAIQFSAALGCERVLALAPHFSYYESWDTRFAEHAKKIPQRWRITEQTFSPNCSYFVAYDPKDPDCLHAQRMAELARIHEVHVMAAKHDVAATLRKRGVFWQFLNSVLVRGKAPRSVNSRRLLWV